MVKNLNVYRFDDDTVFHGIGKDYIALLSIIEHGLLTKKDAMDKNIPGYRPNYSISALEKVSVVGLDRDGYGGGEGFEKWINPNSAQTSLVIDPKKLSVSPIRPAEYTFVSDEQYIESISPEAIDGLMFPDFFVNYNLSAVLAEDLRVVPISKFSTNYNKEGKGQAVIDFIRHYFPDANITELEENINKLDFSIRFSGKGSETQENKNLRQIVGKQLAEIICDGKDPNVVDFLQSVVPEHWKLGYATIFSSRRLDENKAMREEEKATKS